jgi:hypothetical protein
MGVQIVTHRVPPSGNGDFRDHRSWLASGKRPGEGTTLTQFSGAPEHIMVWLEIFLKVLTVGYVCVFVWQTFIRAVEQMHQGEALEVGGSYMSLWPSRYLLPLAGALMMIYLVVRVIRDFGRAINKET